MLNKQAAGLFGKQNTIMRWLIISIASVITGVIVALFGIRMVFFLVAALISAVIIISADPFHLLCWTALSWPFLRFYVRIQLGAGIPDITYPRIMIVLIALALARDIALHKRKLTKFNRIDYLILVFSAFQVFSYLRGVGPLYSTIQALFRTVIEPLAFYYLARQLVRTKQQVKVILIVLVYMGLVMFAIGMYERRIGTNQTIFLVEGLNFRNREETRWMDVPGGRLSSAMINPAATGVVFAVSYAAAMVLGESQRLVYKRLWFILLQAMMIIGAFYTYTRGAWVVFLFIFLVWIFHIWISNYRKFILIVFGAALLILVAWAVSGQVLSSDVWKNRVVEEQHVVTRLDSWLTSFEAFKISPLIGLGAFSLDEVLLAKYPIPSHNTFITFLVDAGIFTFLAYLGVMVPSVVTFLRHYLKLKKTSPRKSIMLFALCAIGAVNLMGFSIELRPFPYLYLLSWLGLVIGQAALKPEFA